MIPIEDYDDPEYARDFFEDAKIYKDLMFGHSAICPNRRFRKNCEEAGLEVVFSENKQKCAVCMAIVDKDGKLLITRRPKEMRIFPWAWVLPGG